MADTLFVHRTTPILADWLNDVNISTYRNVFDTSLLGAVADGVTDNYQVIYNAAQAAHAAGGGVVLLPSGTLMMSSPLQLKGLSNVTIAGRGMGITKLTRGSNFAAASVRFYLGTNNCLRDLSIECDGYAGRGVYLQDIDSSVVNVKVTNCPERPFAMNGGGNSSWGLDSTGLSSDSPSVGTLVFFPIGCKFYNCYAERWGQTAFSIKRMRRYVVNNLYAKQGWAEALTVDVRSDGANIDGCYFEDISRSDSSTEFPDKESPGTYLTVGFGGVGGVGIDVARYATLSNIQIIGVQKNLVMGSRTKAALSFINNIGPSYGVHSSNIHIEDSAIGIWLKGVASGAGGNSFGNVFSNITFKEVTTCIDIDDGCNKNVFTNLRGTESTILTITDNDGDNAFDLNGDGTVALRGVSTAGAFTMATNGDRITWERRGNLVHVNLYLIWTAQTGAVGQLQATGLPFMSSTRPNNNSIASCSVDGLTVTGQVYASIPPGADYVNFLVVENGVRTTLPVSASGDIRVSLSYLVG